MPALASASAIEDHDWECLLTEDPCCTVHRNVPEEPSARTPFPLLLNVGQDQEKVGALPDSTVRLLATAAMLFLPSPPAAARTAASRLNSSIRCTKQPKNVLPMNHALLRISWQLLGLGLLHQDGQPAVGLRQCGLRLLQLHLSFLAGGQGLSLGTGRAWGSVKSVGE